MKCVLRRFMPVTRARPFNIVVFFLQKIYKNV